MGHATWEELDGNAGVENQRRKAKNWVKKKKMWGIRVGKQRIGLKCEKCGESG